MGAFPSIHENGSMKRYFPKAPLCAALVLCALLGHSPDAAAHGESIRGSGSGAINTVGAEIGSGLTLGARYDLRFFERVSDRDLLQFRADSEDVHSHTQEHTWFAGAGYAITENFDVNLQLPINMFRDFQDNGDEYVEASCPIVPGSGDIGAGTSDDCISTTKTSAGIGDLLVLGRYRFFNRRRQHLAAVFGVSLPTGRIRNRVDKVNPATGRREFLGAHNQPGSGAVGFQLGAAYTGHFGKGLSLSADVLARIQGEGLGFRQGNGGQADLGLSWSHPRSPLSPVFELNGLVLQRDIEDGEIKRNSGGGVLYLSPGFVVRLGKRHQIYGSFSYPIVQKLFGIQNDERFRFGVGYAVAFGGKPKATEKRDDHGEHHHHGEPTHRHD